MTKDDIMRMAREAGFVEYELDDGTTNAFDVRYERFANLVAEREREACAKVCDAINAKHIESYGNYLGDTYAVECAAAIRARGTT